MQETCGVLPEDINDPLTALPGASAAHAKTVLDSLVPLSSDAGETQEAPSSTSLVLIQWPMG